MSSNYCDHIGIYTNHARKLEKFYTQKLGFKKEKEEILGQSIVELIFGLRAQLKFIRLTSGSMMIELFEPQSVRIKKKMSSITGYHHWGYCVPDRIKFVKKLKRQGVHVIEVKRNKHTVYFITDPDENLIEIRNIVKG
jgi:catechol 2,3-dioxygenase-like lactoylglutathione lyase family enzyme